MASAPVNPRLRFKRAFLIAAIASLGLGGAIAVAALLLNSFNETTGRILGTLGAMAYHCGAAIAIMAALEKGRGVTVMRVSLGLFAASFAVLVAAIWVFRDDTIFRALASTLFLTGAHALATPGARVLDQGRAPALGWATVGSSAGALLLSLIAVWVRGGDETLARAAGTAGLAAFTAAQCSLLVNLRAAEVLRALYLVTLGAAVTLAAGISVLIWAPQYAEGESAVRLLGAIGVVDAVSTLVLIVMVRLRGTPAAAAVVSEVRSIWLRCPRCSQEQELALGDSACGACGLKISVKVEATTCATCGYALRDLPGRVCPECGTRF